MDIPLYAADGDGGPYLDTFESGSLDLSTVTAASGIQSVSLTTSDEWGGSAVVGFSFTNTDGKDITIDSSGGTIEFVETPDANIGILTGKENTLR